MREYWVPHEAIFDPDDVEDLAHPLFRDRDMAVYMVADVKARDKEIVQLIDEIEQIAITYEPDLAVLRATAQRLRIMLGEKPPA